MAGDMTTILEKLIPYGEIGSSPGWRIKGRLIALSPVGIDLARSGSTLVQSLSGPSAVHIDARFYTLIDKS